MGAAGAKALSCQRTCETTCVEHIGVDVYAVTQCVSSGGHPDGDLAGTEAMNVHKLLVAAKEGRQEEIAELLSQGVPIDRRRPFFMKREQEVIGRSGDLHDTRQPGMTALMYAAQSGYPGCCARLLVGRANPNAEDEDGTRPLHFAASSGSLDVCKLLLEYHADVRAQTDDGKAAFDFVPDDAMPTAKHYQMWASVLKRSLTAKAEAERVPTPPTQTDGSGDAKSELNSSLHEQEAQQELHGE
ncbi:akr1 [Symbiodinium natans]|uniref:Akr1 protein n=1 Tax=Symbiodinium natans TaxID=878477 RepID=A0A812SXY7_9DINO|nr:akr1 [Symbiodinium natans]